MKGYTTIEQSKKLLSLGLDPSTADMYYKYVLPKSDKLHHVPDVGEPTNALSWYNKGYTLNGRKEPLELKDFCIPCWSLTALLELMPSYLPLYPEATEDKVKEGKYRSSDLIASKEGYLRKRFDGYYQYRYDGIHCVGDYNNPLNTAFEMVCWLIEQEQIKVNK